MKKLVYLIFFVFSAYSWSQTNVINYLDPVEISDSRLNENSNGFKVEKIKDSTISHSEASLSGLLRFNSNIYFKENGPGMVSSPSFRGTNAAHTAVIWNGININSQLNGQTDFNTIYTNNYDNISIRSGGGSVLYGSGAIGGSIHLNNRLRFTNHFENELQLSYGSFEYKNLHYKTSYGTEEINISAGVDYIASDNDFKYLGTNQQNENGAYENFNLNLNAGIFLNSKNVLKFYHNSYLGDRNFSGGLYLNAQDRYEDEHSRSLLEWQYSQAKIRSTLRVAQVYEHYKYFGSQSSSEFSFGKANELLAQYDFQYKFSNKLKTSALLEYSNTNAEGSDIALTDRNVFAGVFLLNHEINDKLNYGIQLRKETANDYESPLLFSVDAKYFLSEAYALNFNISKNFRMPTFNDLYWQPGGNLDLEPETSYQAEVGQEYDFRNFIFSLNGYFIKSRDMIKWVPQGNLWSPQNINEVNSYGLEAGLNFQKKINEHEIVLEVDYAYTISKNVATKQQLMYVPWNKTTASAAYSFGRFSGFYEFLWNGAVYTTNDETAMLEDYQISNIGISYDIFRRKNIEAELFLRLNNVYNEKYQITFGRPMPPRNFQIQLTINI